MDQLQFISIKDTIECFKNEVLSKETYSRFIRCIEAFKLKHDDNIIPFIYLIINDAEAFKSQLPKEWRKDSTKAVGVSAINKCINISIIKNKIGLKDANIIRTALSAYIKELQNKNEDKSSTYSSDKNESNNDNDNNDDNTDNYIVIINQLNQEKHLHKYKNEKLFKMITAFSSGDNTTIQQEWLSLTSELLNMVS